MVAHRSPVLHQPTNLAESLARDIRGRSEDRWGFQVAKFPIHSEGRPQPTSTEAIPEDRDIPRGFRPHIHTFDCHLSIRSDRSARTCRWRGHSPGSSCSLSLSQHPHTVLGNGVQNGMIRSQPDYRSLHCCRTAQDCPNATLLRHRWDALRPSALTDGLCEHSRVLALTQN